MFEEIGREMGDLEAWCDANGLRWIVGVDEAGRGPLAGPVYTAAVALDCRELSADWIGPLDDSKKLEEAVRERCYEEIRGQAAAWAIESCGPEVIDEINILQATRRAMARSVERVCEALEEPVGCVFVDGNVAIDVSARHRTLVKGDARSYAVAAASILAKVARDRVMAEAHEEWPVYNFASNKGYPTQDHRRALQEHGPCPIHRRSFSGVE